MTVISLPWPPSELSPNSRTDRRAATGKRRMYREAGFYAAKEAKAVVPADARLVITFFPPDDRRRDLDNMLASIKSGLDGIAKASGVDDSGWGLVLNRGESVRNGKVVIYVVSQADGGWRRVGDVLDGLYAEWGVSAREGA